jgi:hypothetical protein
MEALGLAALRPHDKIAQGGDEQVERGLDSDSVGSISMAPWTTYRKYMVIG